MMTKTCRSAEQARKVCAILAVAASLLPLGAALGVEEIRSFHSDIHIDATGTMDVVERISVTAERGRIKHGIYRDFPTDYRDRYGNRYKVKFEIRHVKRDGRPEAFHTKSTSKGVRVYLGRENVVLPKGQYTYEISYRTDRQLGFFDDHDELYWNVTGNEWDFGIARASAAVHLPEPVDRNALTIEGYTGPTGSKRSDLVAKVVSGSEAHFETSRPLGRREGLTIVFGWPKGLVREPTAGELATELLRDNRHLLASAIGFSILLGYYLLFWSRVGQDPEAGVVIARYEPPDGYSPASMRYIDEMGYDKKCFTAAVINLAVKGFLTIEEDDGAYGLVKTAKNVEMAPGEEKLAKTLFSGGERIELDNKNHKVMGKALETHEQALSDDYENKYFVTNRGYFFVGAGISVIVIMAVLFLYPELADSAQVAFLCVWATIWWSATGMGLYRGWISLRHARGASSRIAAIVRVAFLVPFVFAGLAVVVPVVEAGATDLVVIGLVLLVTNALFYHWLKAPTMVGRKLLDKADGFKRYVEVAEKIELDARYSEGRTPELFERYLPYAIALGIEQKWAEQFAAIIKQAAMGADAYSPVWYHGDNWQPTRLSDFSSSLSDSFNGAVASSSTAPGSSSGGGGGGFSGGGGGGGGGGGW